MGKKKYGWHLGAPLPRIDAHSIAKHEMLSEYLRLYVHTLARNVKREELRLTLVDGFAGGGLYRRPPQNELWLGSPLRMIQAMQEVDVVEQSRRSKPFHLDVEYVFIEKGKDTFEFLRKTLTDFGYLPSLHDQISLRNTTFGEQVDALVHEISARGRKPRAIFVLDQFGYKDAPLDQIRTILQRIEKAEVILTFATDCFLNYVSERKAFQQIIDAAGLGFSASELAGIKKSHPTTWRTVLQHLLHERVRERTGAKYYTPFFVHSPDSNRAYWLLHLSRHYRAKDVMTRLHWELSNHFVHYGGAGLGMLGFDPRKDDLLRRSQEFLFDLSAESASAEALYEELPSRIGKYANGTPFIELFADIANETPATSEQLKKTLITLHHDRRIKLYHKNGSRLEAQVRLADQAIVQLDRRTISLPFS